MILQSTRIKTPVGDLLLVARDDAACAIAFADCAEGVLASLARRFHAPRITLARDPGGIVSFLEAYLAGEATALDRVRVDLGGTPFQRRVWAALRTIVPGAPIAYHELAARIGSPGAARAVALANARNPVAIVIPCHRVIGKDGALRGYAGGLARKAWLLAHEASGQCASMVKNEPILFVAPLNVDVTSATKLAGFIAQEPTR